MTRAGTIAIPAALLGLFTGLLILALPGIARAQSGASPAAVDRAAVDEFSAQSRDGVRRTPRRIRIYRGSAYPGPNSKRVCNAHYEQEYRPSGTVIVPRMNCYWSG